MNARTISITVVAVLTAVILIFPWVGEIFDIRFPTSYEMRLVVRAMILCMVVIGLNILVGLAGLVSLGQAALYGLGAHVAALLALRLGFSFVEAMIAAVILPAIVGAFLAFPTLRVRALYLTVITIAFGLVFENILREWISLTGGYSGLTGIPRPTVLGERLVTTKAGYFNFYYLIVAILALAFWMQWSLKNSYLGRAMRASAQSENAARALGINIVAIRTLAFAISAGLAGLGGGLFANFTLFVNYETFTFGASIELLLMTILGGAGTLAGPAVGTSILFVASQALQGLHEWQTFGYGLLLALVLFLLPEGIMGSLAQLKGRLFGGRAGIKRRVGTWPQFGPEFSLGGSDGARSEENAIRANGLTLRFGGLTAVNDVSLLVRPGTVHAVIGPNGAGKSSLFNIISGFHQATDGSVTLFGRPLDRPAPHVLARRGVARTFQNTELFGRMTVLENVLVGCHVRYKSTLMEVLLRLPRLRAEERRTLAEARTLLEIVGLHEFADEEARNLPFGHQRRLEIARALGVLPKLLLLDEPAAGLTHGEIDDLIRLIRGLADRGITVILVEHHVEMIMAVSDRVTVLDYGEVIAEGLPSEIQDDPRVVEAYFGHGAPAAERAAAS